MNTTETALAHVIQYSGLGFCNLDHALTKAVIETAELNDDDATYRRVEKAILAGQEKVQSVARISGKRVSVEHQASILAQYALAA